jgi:hypothetical protein
VPCILGLPFANVTPGQVTSDDCVTQPSTGLNYVAAEPPFAGVYGHPWGFDAGNHPNAAGANASANEAIRAFDNLPVQGGQNEPVFTPVVGQPQLYSTTPSLVSDPDDTFGSGGLVSINRKLMATGASCGSHPLIDVSGPDSSIHVGTAGSYTYCFARAAGECLSTSAVGEIFVNCPGVVVPSCAGTGIHGGTPLGVGNDICVGNIGNGADAIIQYSLDQTDYYGATRRPLVSATSRLRMVTGFENNQLLPDNSWLLFRAEFLNYQRQEMWMAQVPSYPPTDNYDRGQFIPVMVTVPAHKGADNAVVEFGYQEYGLPAGYPEGAFMNCTTRNDPCWANTAQAASPPYSENSPPFYFKSENPGAMACSATAGCTIAVPGISQRMLFARVLYFNGSKQIAASAISVVNVP